MCNREIMESHNKRSLDCQEKDSANLLESATKKP